MTDRIARARSFGVAAAAYDRGRPSYPDAAVRWSVPENAGRVVDLGAGTGKLTQVLVRLGWEVVAVEPLAGMRAQLSENLPEVQVLDGTGEHIPLPDSSVDAVCCAQAWHWVDPERASPEVARVLRPGGVLALLWNGRLRGSGWAAALDDLLVRTDGNDATGGPVAVTAPLVGPDRFDVEWADPTTPETLVDMLVSRSYFITMSPSAKKAFLADLEVEVLQLMREDPAPSLPYRTECWVYHLPA